MKPLAWIPGTIFLFVVGCISSGGPPPPRFSASASVDHAAAWVGRYSGMGSAYTHATGDWQQDQELELTITSLRPNTLSIAATARSPGGWSFALEIEAAPTAVLAGEQLGADSARYEYSFARGEARISGVVKRRSAEAAQSPDEWVFEVVRQPDDR